MTLAGKTGQQARLWEVGDVGGVAAVDGDGDPAFKFLVADVVDVDAGGFLERRYRLFKQSGPVP
jgi:hypothetical protein